jgi:hypothetical protein
MSEIALANINSFASQEMQDNVPQAEEAVFILTSSQLKDIIREAAKPLLKRIESLEDVIARQDAKITALETTQEHDVSRLALDIAYDRQRLAKLERIEPQPLQRDRGEILRALLAANGGKMLAKDARQKMHLIKPRFSELLATMGNAIEIRPYHLKKNQKVLVLK